MKTGIELIAQERQEQIEKHGRRVIDDVSQNGSGQLKLGATILIGEIYGLPFPKEWDKIICERMLNKPIKDRLIIAGALIAAEIDRMNFMEAKQIMA